MTSENGDLKQVEYENGNYVDYTYDDYGNISAISQDGDTNFKWQYDSTGNMYAHDDLVNNQRFVYTYDSTGRLVRQQVLDSGKKNLYSSQYGYDLNNNVSRLTSSAGGVSVTENFEYGKDNLASKYTYPSGKTATYTYDGILRRNKTVINTTTPIEQTYKYMASARGNGTQTTKIDEEKLGGNLYKYTYDANGNITCIMCKKNTDTDFVKQQQFAYDELNQLIRADDLAKNRTEVYNYDNGGNILSTTVYPLTWGSLDGVTATSTLNYTYGDSNWKDKLTAYGDTPITYDAIGNPLSYRGYTLTWQNGRQLASMRFGTVNIGFTYDVDGLRTSKNVHNVDLEHKYYYVGNRLQYETIGDSSALWYFYDADGNPSGIRYKDHNGTVNDYYFVCNWRGDVIQIYNASGVLVATYDYDAWGRVSENSTDKDTQNIAEINPIRYRGYYYDSETGLYYVNSRYYDPAVKQFINADDIDYLGIDGSSLSYNMFAYCMNNPVNRFDINGNWSLPNWAKVTIGAVAIAGLAVATACTGGVAAVICGAALSGAIAGGASGTIVGAIGGGISGGWQGVLNGACSGFMSGTLIGGVTGAASAGLNIAAGTTTIVGNAHGSILHKVATNMEAGKMAASGRYSQIGVNKALKTMGLNGSNRPDVIGIAKKGVHKLVEVVSPRQSINYIVNKMSKMISNNPRTVGKIVKWVRYLFK